MPLRCRARVVSLMNTLSLIRISSLQVEFYFSDSNLYRDAFLHEKITSDPEGFVDIAILCIFNRLKRLLGIDAKSAVDVSDASIQRIVDAVEGSSEVVVSEDKKRLKRASAMDKDASVVAQEIDARSLMVGPFRFDVPLEELEGYFETLGKVNAVRMRRHVSSKDFRGSVFAEFESQEECDRVLHASKGGEGFVYDGATLVMEPKVDFMKRKEEEKLARVHAAQKEREDVEKAIEVLDAEIEEFGAEPGTFVKFDFGDVTLGDTVTFGMIKDSFGGKEKGLLFVEYTHGDTVGYARFSSSAEAQAALEENGKRLLAGFEATLTVLDGEDEKEYIKKVLVLRKKAALDRAKKDKQGRGSGRGRGRGRGGNRGGKRPGRGGMRGRNKRQKS